MQRFPCLLATRNQHKAERVHERTSKPTDVQTRACVQTLEMAASVCARPSRIMKPLGDSDPGFRRSRDPTWRVKRIFEREAAFKTRNEQLMLAGVQIPQSE